MVVERSRYHGSAVWLCGCRERGLAREYEPKYEEQAKSANAPQLLVGFMHPDLRRGEAGTVVQAGIPDRPQLPLARYCFMPGN